MTMTDPIVDMPTCLCNANRAHHDTASVPYSRLENAITNMLAKEDYLASIPVEDARVGKIPILTLRYGSHREPAIKGLQCVSKPGLHMYAKPTNLPKVYGGLGVAILSMSSGLLIDRQAADRGMGGEVLAYVW